MYHTECQLFLNDEHSYTRVKKDPSPDVMEEIAFLVNKCLDSHWITKEDAAFLLKKQSKVPYFYILSTVHKNKHPPPGRPIVSGINSILEPLLEFCDSFF